MLVATANATSVIFMLYFIYAREPRGCGFLLVRERQLATAVAIALGTSSGSGALGSIGAMLR